MAQDWKDAGITALLSPCFPSCAFKAESAMELGNVVEYCMMQNLTGFPAGVLPITRVRPDEQSFADIYRDKWTQALERDCHDSANMPVAV